LLAAPKEAVNVNIRHVMGIAGRFEDFDAGRHMRQVGAGLLDPLLIEA